MINWESAPLLSKFEGYIFEWLDHINSQLKYPSTSNLCPPLTINSEVVSFSQENFSGTYCKYVYCCVYSRMPWIWQPAFAITLACYCCRRLWKMATGLAYTLHKFRHKLEIVVTFMAWKPIVMRIAPPELCCCCCRYITQQLHTNEAQLRCWCHTIFCELKSSAAIRRRNGGDC